MHCLFVSKEAILTCGFSIVGQVASSGVFELKVHSFITSRRFCRRTRDCNIFFRICLKHSEDVISAEPPCTFGTGQTSVLRADQSSIANSAAIRVPFHFKWPVILTFCNIIQWVKSSKQCLQYTMVYLTKWSYWSLNDISFILAYILTHTSPQPTSVLKSTSKQLQCPFIRNIWISFEIWY